MLLSQPKQPSSGKKSFISRIFPLMLIVIGMLSIIYGAYVLILASASLNWPTTQGIVLESTVERHHTTTRKWKTRKTYHAKIFYEFSVKGVTFKGSSISSGDYDSNNPSHAEQIVNEYPKGKYVTVHYKPDNPEKCVLESGLKTTAWTPLLIGIIFTILGGIIATSQPKVTKSLL